MLQQNSKTSVVKETLTSTVNAVLSTMNAPSAVFSRVFGALSPKDLTPTGVERRATVEPVI